MHPRPPKLACVVTTIQPPTPAMRALAARLSAIDACPLIVIGDQQGPATYDVPGCDFYSLHRQGSLPFTLAARLPVNHYARKTLGYLLAARLGAECIYETDDDNAPAAGWTIRQRCVPVQLAAPRAWLNVFRLFSKDFLWPRGFPLDELRHPESFAHDRALPLTRMNAVIQQGLSDGSPDVDAIWRLVQDKSVQFDTGPSVLLPHNTWCPFNSQSTWWWPIAYPLMYLPSFCSVRETDIWRSFIAQRCLWEIDSGVAFHSAEVVQDRNAHDLMRDFVQEIRLYTSAKDIAALLTALSLGRGAHSVGENLRRCYEALVANGYFPKEELALVAAYLDDLGTVSASLSRARN